MLCEIKNLLIIELPRAREVLVLNSSNLKNTKNFKNWKMYVYNIPRIR